MTETLEYIEAYFTNGLDQNEKKSFEKRCETDEAFAQEVADYTLARAALREQLVKQKQTQWKALEASNEKKITAPVKRIPSFRQWAPYAAAACVLMAVVFTYLNGNTSPGQLADKYFTEHYMQLSHTMDGGKETIEQGIEFYNNKNYDSALALFQKADNDYPVQKSSTKKYEGYVYLVKKDFENALQQFDELSKMQLYSNPGIFLKALTLMQRNKEGDKEEAKILLQQVIDQNLEGKEDAEEMMRSLK